jgi:hypothetical protein
MAQLQLRLRAIRSVFALLLIASTWRLWFPVGGDDTFPLIPFFGLLIDIPVIVDLFCSGGLVCALLLELVDSVYHLKTNRVCRRSRFAWFGVLFWGSLLVVLNQQRLQPWMYHFMLLTPILSLPPTMRSSVTSDSWFSGRSSFGLLLALTGSIYAWSAWSKLDVSFIHNHGSHFVDAIAGCCGLSTRFWTPGMRSATAALMPVGELLVAIALVSPRTRWTGLIVSLGMHGLLILAVGPWGMDQSSGVILWNLYFMAQNAVLAVYILRADKSETPGPTAAEGQRPKRTRDIVTLVTLIACLAPVLRVFDCFDNWPSWAVYAASTRRVRVLIEPDALQNAPRELRDCIERRRLQDGSAWLRIDQWALTEFHAPIYPQDRLQVGVALAVSRRFQLGDSIRLVIEGPADRFSGERTVTEYIGQAAIKERAADYRLNTEARMP